MNQQREADLTPWKPNGFCCRDLGYVDLNREVLRRAMNPRLVRCADVANSIIRDMIGSARAR